jgi:two-component system, cell cycle sensor histidine kinase and response regulator CckA
VKDESQTKKARPGKLGVELALQNQLIDAARDAIITCDGDRRITRWNQGAEELYGWTAQEAVGQLIHELLRTEFPSQDEHVDTILEREGRWDGELRHTRKDGTQLICLSRHILLRNANRGAFLEINRDITERKHAAERLARAYRLAHLGTWEHEMEAGVFEYSDEVLGMLDIRRAAVEPSANVFFDYCHPDDQELFDDAWRKAMRAGRNYEIDHRIVARNGELRHLRHFIEFQKEGGRPVCVIGTTQDITDYKRLEQQTRRSQKLESLGLLAGGVAHDFNNFLSIVIGYAELLRETVFTDTPARKQLSEILRAGKQASEVARQLTVFSRNEVIRPRPISLNALILESGQSFDRLLGDEIRIVNNLAPSLGVVMADPGMMQQVLLNMVLNARDAMPLGGKVLFETSNVVVDEEFAAQHEGIVPGPYVCMIIGDTGMGMDEKTRERIFEPFFTTKAAGLGTGLGLATVYGIIRQAKGAIWVYSEPGQGTTFKIFLPRVDEQAAANELKEAAVPQGGSETILLVEDQEQVREVTSTILKRYGYKVIEAANGAEALKTLSDYGGPVHLVLSDVIMPEMSGAELVKRAMQMKPNLIAVFMSGHTDQMLANQGVLEIGMRVLHKPFPPAELATTIREVLEAPR